MTNICLNLKDLFCPSVPSENKKDLRSIEETLNDIRAKKRQRMTNVDNDGGQSDDVAVE